MSELTATQIEILTATTNRTDGSIHPLPARIKGGAVRKVCDSMKTKFLIDADERIAQVGRNALWATYSPEEQKVIMESAEDDMEFTADAKAMAANVDDSTALAMINAAKEALGTTTEEQEATLTADAKEIEDDMADDLAAREMATFMGTRFTTNQAQAIETTDLAIDLAADLEPDVAIDEKAIKTRRTRENSKQAMVIAMLKRTDGATTAQIMEATGWLNHTSRAFLSIAKKKLGLEITTIRHRVVGPNQEGSPGSYTTYFAH